MGFSMILDEIRNSPGTPCVTRVKEGRISFIDIAVMLSRFDVKELSSRGLDCL